MTTKAILKALQASSARIPLDEVEKIMDRELQKSPEQMDDELIDLCMDILEKGYAEQDQELQKGSEQMDDERTDFHMDIPDKGDAEQDRKQTNQKRRGRKVCRILAVAAILLLTAAVAVPVAAKFFHTNASDKIVQFYSDHFHIDLRQGETTARHYSDTDAELIQELQKRGFENIILPEELLKYDHADDIFMQNNEHFTSATIDIEDVESKINGAITITQYDKATSSSAGDAQISSKYTSVEQINVNGLDVIVFANDEEAFIRYLDEHTEYVITVVNCDIDSAMKIANSIK